MQEMNIKNYPHLGDALWEVFVREKTIFLTNNLQKLHKITVKYVRAEFQADMLEKIMGFLNEEELNIVKRCGNIQTSSLRKIDRNLHRKSTQFEGLLGWLYLTNKERYNEILNKIEDRADFNCD